MEAIGYDEVVRMIRGAASQIRSNREHLSKLDSATGDGDHGTAMLRAMAAAEKAGRTDEVLEKVRRLATIRQPGTPLVVQVLRQDLGLS